ncbi:molybdenum ABC transporter ModABC, ATP-binding protein [Campylobacter avium LMG 24591]|uniref:Molybdenum ABC transporter ModABC, ATP-binding protein n=1 Tax=Campylobacter avium LMG 24591 TaxID=522484 RepID=A0A222MW90_9BACT|nr:ATP-binding cassette domain-containing protein [Campylobacter avium]ASQ29890.1 molybdenum ABC transporter ModABC, ATP-binding protein [Campylobacter avium LMG 24591]OYD78989.1 molybdenum ABC transporter ModABC, ATP-binding protein [Campylobacter avium]
MIKIKIKHPLNTANGKVLLDFDKEIKSGDFVAIFGESGAGKTTILRIIAGLLEPEYGFISVDDELWLDTEKKFSLNVQKRRVGFVFQDYALFPNLTVAQNLAYALTSKKDKAKVDEFLELTRLSELKNSYPSKLSGGQCQRVALARALIREPKILLLDEPLSALDYKMRIFFQDELLKLYEHFKLTSLLVSHDIAEIYRLAKRVIELKNAAVVKDCAISEFFSKNDLSAKLQLRATVLEIKKADILMVLTILLGTQVAKISLSKHDFEKRYKNLRVGDTIQISQKAFNPLITSLED